MAHASKDRRVGYDGGDGCSRPSRSRERRCRPQLDAAHAWLGVRISGNDPAREGYCSEDVRLTLRRLVTSMFCVRIGGARPDAEQVPAHRGGGDDHLQAGEILLWLRGATVSSDDKRLPRTIRGYLLDVVLLDAL